MTLPSPIASLLASALLTVIALKAAAATPTPSLASGGVFKAGAATGDITPELGQMIIGDWTPMPAKHIHDRLQVRVLVCDDGARRIAFVVCDNLSLPREVCDEARRLTAERTGILPQRIMISSTHTHSAASADHRRVPRDAIVLVDTDPAAAEAAEAVKRYQRLITRRIADTVQCAINHLVPARVGWGRASEPSQVFNRRWFISDEKERRNPFGGTDQVRMNPPRAISTLIRPAGPTDPDIPFLAVQTRDGRPIALLATYSLHYVGGVGSGVVSADYYGVFAERLAELIGTDRRDPPFVGMLANGTSGDINNIDFRAKAAPRAPFEQIRIVADRVAGAVAKAYRNVEYKSWVPVDARLDGLPIGNRRPDEAMLRNAKELLAKPEGQPAWHRFERLYARRIVARAEAPETVAIPLQALRVGEFAVLTIPAESFVEIGLELKAKAAFEQVAVVSHANGSYGYLPTPAQHQLGGYETWLGTNHLEIEASPKIVQALLAQARALKAAD